jgi:hypothetical protein
MPKGLWALGKVTKQQLNVRTNLNVQKYKIVQLVCIINDLIRTNSSNIARLEK